MMSLISHDVSFNVFHLQKEFPHQPPEDDEGNREYKLKLTPHHKIQKIATQLRFRLYEGEGKALYLIGVSDDGMSMGLTLDVLYESVKYLQQACTILHEDSVKIDKIRIYSVKTPENYVATIRISGSVK